MPPITAIPVDAPARPVPGLDPSWRQQLQGALLGTRTKVGAGAAGGTDLLPPPPATSTHVRFPVLNALLHNPAAVVGLVLLGLIVGIALTAGIFFPGDPLDIVAQPLLRPGEDAAYWFGTDALGRDIAAGLAHGARVSLLVGLTAASVGVTVGTLIGATAGYFGGKVDAALTWLIEIFQTTPTFLLVVVIVSITQSSLEVIAIVIGLTTWETVARLIRAQFRALLSSDFVMAARSIGFGHRWIIFREILPNALPPVVVTASVMVAGAILMESSLAFLGVGDANKVSWGSMIGGGRDMLRTAWFLTVIPGLALVVTVFSLNLLGDALIEAMNPRLRDQRGGRP